MRPFKVGDEVIRIGQTNSLANVIQGKKYTIKTFRSDGFFLLLDRCGWWNPRLFELVPKAASGFKAFQQKLKKT